MSRKYILATTLTRHFIYYSKLMGFYPKVRMIYRELCDILNKMHAYKEDDIMFFSKGSYDRFIGLYLRFGRKYLNEAFIKNAYFCGEFSYKLFKESEVDELINLFFDYLKDKKIYKNIRIEV